MNNTRFERLNALLKAPQNTSYEVRGKLASKIQQNYQPIAFTLKEVCAHLYLTNYFAVENFVLSLDYQTNSTDLRLMFGGFLCVWHDSNQCIFNTLFTTRLLEQQIQSLLEDTNLRYSWMLVVRDI